MSFFNAGTASVSIQQGDYAVPSFTITSGGSAIDILTDYDDIKCDIREGKSIESPLVKRVSLSDGITVTDTNTLNVDVTNDSTRDRLYGAVKFQITGTSNWVTLLFIEVVIVKTTTEV